VFISSASWFARKADFNKRHIHQAFYGTPKQLSDSSIHSKHVQKMLPVLVIDTTRPKCWVNPCVGLNTERSENSCPSVSGIGISPNTLTGFTGSFSVFSASFGVSNSPRDAITRAVERTYVSGARCFTSIRRITRHARLTGTAYVQRFSQPFVTFLFKPSAESRSRSVIATGSISRKPRAWRRSLTAVSAASAP